MLLAIAYETDDNKIEAMLTVCSKGGFVDEKTLYYKPRVGRVVYNMNEPISFCSLEFCDSSASIAGSHV